MLRVAELLQEGETGGLMEGTEVASDRKRTKQGEVPWGALRALGVHQGRVGAFTSTGALFLFQALSRCQLKHAIALWQFLSAHKSEQLLRLKKVSLPSSARLRELHLPPRL